MSTIFYKCKSPVSIKFINSHLHINYLNQISTFQSLIFQCCDYDAEEQGYLKKKIFFRKEADGKARSLDIQNTEHRTLKVRVGEGGKKENTRIEEGRGRTREGKGRQKAIACKLVPLCHCAFGSSGSWTVTDNHPACCLWHTRSGLRHQDASVKLPCQLAPVQPDFSVQALSVPIQPRCLPHKTLPFLLLR